MAGPPPDATLGGYVEKHGRPPAFGGSDGAFYSVDILLTPRDEDEALERAFGAALMFVKWSADGAQPVGHLETDYLYQSDDRFDARAVLSRLSLREVKEHLDRAIEARQEIPDW